MKGPWYDWAKQRAWSAEKGQRWLDQFDFIYRNSTLRSWGSFTLLSGWRENCGICGFGETSGLVAFCCNERRTWLFFFLVPFFTKRIFVFLRISFDTSRLSFSFFCSACLHFLFISPELGLRQGIGLTSLTFAGGIESSTTFQVLLNLFYLVICRHIWF